LHLASVTRNARALACLIALAALAAGCGDQVEVPGEDRSGEPVKLFFTGGEQFNPVTRDLEVSGSTLEEAAEKLVAGPTAEERAAADPAQTQIPAGTEVEGVSVSDGEAEVELSDEFLEGVPADPAERTRDQEQELAARVGQVTYTLTQFDEVESASVLAAGEVVAPDVDRSDYLAPVSDPKPVAKPLGARDPGVRWVQVRLWRFGYLPKSAIDGLDGYRTQQAVMAFQSWEGLDRDGVAGPATKRALRSARRPKPRRGGPPKRIEVYRDRGVALLVKDGRTKRAVHVSAGAPGTETPPGTFEVFRKELQSWSVPFSTWLPYASYFNQGIAFHEYPDVPPFPASHGCVRVSAPEAPFVYEFAAIGTTVRVF
jgi:peptidoglycan hydrolase-like protein with peptidoglycan-binding domain